MLSKPDTHKRGTNSRNSLQSKIKDVTLSSVTVTDPNVYVIRSCDLEVGASESVSQHRIQIALKDCIFLNIQSQNCEKVFKFCDVLRPTIEVTN